MSVLETVDRLAHAQLKLASLVDENKCGQLKSSVRLTAKAVLARVNKHYESSGIKHEMVKQLCEKLESVIRNL